MIKREAERRDALLRRIGAGNVDAPQLINCIRNGHRLTPWEVAFAIDTLRWGCRTTRQRATLERIAARVRRAGGGRQ